MMLTYELFQLTSPDSREVKRVGKIYQDNITQENVCLQLDDYFLPIYLDHVKDIQEFVNGVFYNHKSFITTGSYYQNNPMNHQKSNLSIVFEDEYCGDFTCTSIQIRPMTHNNLIYSNAVFFAKKTFHLTSYQMDILKNNGHIYVLEDQHEFGMGFQRVMLVFNNISLLDIFVDMPNSKSLFFKFQIISDEFYKLIRALKGKNIKQTSTTITLNMITPTEIVKTPVSILKVDDKKSMLSIGTFTTDIPYSNVRNITTDQIN